MIEFNYTPDGQELRNFMQSKAFVRGVQGPIGSGKTACCVAEMLRLALGQERCFDPKTVRRVGNEFIGERTGPRKVRSGVIRNTTPQLETTTMKTWLEWLPEEQFGGVRWRPPYRQNIYIPGYDLEWEIWFLALDRDEDVRKLLSFEFTNIMINEARELSRYIVTSAISRVRRYPRKVEGGATQPCIIMDTNAPDEEHWWSIMSGQAPVPEWVTDEDRLTLIKPDNWEFFIQPPAMFDVWDGAQLVGYELNPDRENGLYTDEAYYTELIRGQTRDWIKNMVQNKIGTTFAGRPVYRDFNEQTHVAAQPLDPVPGYTLHVGVDFGRTPAISIGQDIRGRWRTIDEIVSRDMGAVQFAPIVAKHLAQHYPNFEIELTGDPAGANDNEVGDTTPIRIFDQHGLKVKPCWTNDPEIRIGAVDTQLTTMVEGQPAYQVSPSCTYTVAAKKGGYCYKKDREEIDKKSIYSHVSDAEQYAMLGAGLGRKLVGRASGHKQVVANRKQSLFDRKGMTARQRHKQSILSRGRK